MKLKIVVYAIARNESGFVGRWMDSMGEADGVFVLDTGSSDGSVELLRARGAKVEVRAYDAWRSVEEYRTVESRGGNPWRFDRARNDAMDAAMRIWPDADVLVSTDLDEILTAGWRDRVEAAWNGYRDRHGEFPTTGVYEYIWNFTPDGKPGTRFWYEKIHAPDAARWGHPVHEVLEYAGAKRTVNIGGMRLEHHADPAKSRGQYLPMLELSVAERPDDDRNVHYLGREYMFRGEWRKAVDTLRSHLALPGATWRAERAASMRYIARCRRAMGDAEGEMEWLAFACIEEPGQREAALELAEAAFAAKRWWLVVRACERCLAVRDRSMTYLSREEAWGARPYDLLAIGLWNTGRKVEAVDANARAMALDPGDARLAENDRIMRSMLEGKS